MSKFVEANEKIAEKVVEGYKKIEDGVVNGYKKIETGVVEGFGKVTDACVKTLFAQFGGDMTPEEQRLFIILTGAGVSVAVVTLSVLRIVKATKEIRRYKNGE